MTFGVPERGDHPWTLPEKQSRPLIRKAIEMGINFFDTANAYSDGTSEEIVGQALKDYTRRDEVVIATKVFFPMSKGPNGGGLSRKAIFTAIDASLRRLGTDYVDLYQIHRWDSNHADRGDAGGAARRRQSGQGALSRRLLHVCMAVRQGTAPRARATLDAVRQHAESLQPAVPRGRARNAAALRDERIGVLPWSPLARGRLARDWDTETTRTPTDTYGNKLFAASTESDRRVVEQVGAIAAAREVPRAQVALAWLTQKSVVTAPIVGASKPQHLDDALAALTLELTDAEIAPARGPLRSASGCRPSMSARLNS